MVKSFITLAPDRHCRSQKSILRVQPDERHNEHRDEGEGDEVEQCGLSRVHQEETDKRRDQAQSVG
jgi:hypothetical protein